MSAGTEMKLAELSDRLIRVETRLCALMHALGVNPASPHDNTPGGVLVHPDKMKLIESVLVDIATETANGNSDPDTMARALDNIVATSQEALRDLYRR